MAKAHRSSPQPIPTETETAELAMQQQQQNPEKTNKRTRPATTTNTNTPDTDKIPNDNNAKNTRATPATRKPHHQTKPTQEGIADVDIAVSIGTTNANTKESKPPVQMTRITRKQNANQILAVSRSSQLGANTGWEPMTDRCISQQLYPKITSTRTPQQMPHLHVEPLHDYPTHSARPPGGERQHQSLIP